MASIASSRKARCTSARLFKIDIQIFKRPRESHGFILPPSPVDVAHPKLVCIFALAQSTNRINIFLNTAPKLELKPAKAF
jgi:hypothetical protein